MSQNKLSYYLEQADKIIKEHVDHEREEFEDRNVLERIIFPNLLALYEPQSVLDIGREDYQSFYNEFFEGRELWTMDRRPTRVEFGSENHISADVATLKKHFKNDRFDLIIMNGVFGWGLNDPKKIEKAFAAIYDILKPGGVFVFGYNDWDNKPMEIQAIENLKKLKPLYFEPLKGEWFKCVNGEHTYRFFIKK
jgi:SAM-dependent methyltransferase